VTISSGSRSRGEHFALAIVAMWTRRGRREAKEQ
jgi:hypothetical protein